MATFNHATPDQGASKSMRVAVKETRFGDGYSQRVGDGINALQEDWTLNFAGRTKATVLSIDTFLRSQAGTLAFDWVTPEGVSKKFICKDWSYSAVHDSDWSLSAKFEQRPA
jgi:phage-related protein